MNLLYIQPHSEWGAAEEYFQIITEGVKRAHPDWKLSLLCPLQTKERWHQHIGSFAEVIPAEKTLPALTRQIKNVAPDLIHLNHPDIKALAASRWARVPEIVITDHSAPTDIRYNWKGTLLWQFLKRASNLHLIAFAQANKKLLIEKHGFFEEQVDVIPHGLRSEAFDIVYDLAQVRHELNIPKESFLLMCVARLSKEKAHEVLLEALREVMKSTSKTVHLLFAGDGDRRTCLEAYAARLDLKDSVRFLGHRSDVARLLQSADAFVLSSDFESFGIAILEAMAVGKFVIATQAVGNTELVSGGAGILVPPRNPKAFAEAILWAMEHRVECQKRGETARRCFLSEYTSEKMIEKTLALYERLLTDAGVASK